MAVPKAIPVALVEAIVAGRLEHVEDLSLDWWEIGEDDLAKIMKHCPQVTRLRLKTAFPMTRMVSPVEPTEDGDPDHQFTPRSACLQLA